MDLRSTTPATATSAATQMAPATSILGTAAVQYLAAIFGVVGAIVLAVPGLDPALGFAAFLVSNVGWLGFSAVRRHWGLFAQQAVFLLVSLVGIWNWWLGPWVLG